MFGSDGASRKAANSLRSAAKGGRRFKFDVGGSLPALRAAAIALQKLVDRLVRQHLVDEGDTASASLVFFF
jgi:hypothetical protein